MLEEQVVKLSSGGVMSATYLKHALNSFLPLDQQQAFVESCGKPLRKSIRVNTLKCSVEKFLDITNFLGWKLDPIPWCEQGFWIDADVLADVALGNLPEHIQGLFYIQEASSMLPPVALFSQVELINEQQPLVVDMAAAPGSKTTQIAALLQNRGIVLANELSASRLKSLHTNLVRCGILNTCMSHLDARKIGTLMPGQFDYVLLDAPCGGEGTVRKDVQALRDWQLTKVEELAELQKELIVSAYKALKPGGTMVYSTCTLSLEENHRVADYLVENSDAVVQPLAQLFEGAEKVTSKQGYLLVLPHIFDSEGFFVACFHKPVDAINDYSIKNIYSSPFETPKKKTRQEIVGYYQKHFGIEIEPQGFKLLQRDKEIWLFPEAIDLVSPFLKVNRAGMKIAKIYPNKIRSSHEMACCLGAKANKQFTELSPQQLEMYWRGQNITIDDNEVKSGEVLLRYQESVIGVAQLNKGAIKNALPRELVRDNYCLPS